MQFFKTISLFFSNPFINPYLAIFKHIKWQFIKIANLFPQTIHIHDDLCVRIYRDSSAIGALINGMGYYDPNNMFLIRDLINERVCDTFFDVGANIGIYTLIAAKSGAHCIAFEPHPVTFQLLMENIRINYLGNKVIGLPIALGAMEGKVHLTNQPGSSINQVTDQGDLEVEIKPGKRVIQEQSVIPDIVKIDVEGYENEVLIGFGDLLSQIKFLFIEVRDIKKTMHILEPYGFLGPFKVDYKEGILGRWSRPSWEDYLFVNMNISAELSRLGFKIHG